MSVLLLPPKPTTLEVHGHIIGDEDEIFFSSSKRKWQVKAKIMAQPAVLLTTLGSIEPFDQNSGLSFEAWVELFEQFCEVNRIPQEPTVIFNGRVVVQRQNNRRRALFLSSVGSRAYSVLHCMFLPEQPSDKSIPQLVAALMNQYAPPGLLPANRMTFNGRNRMPKESVHDYIAALQQLAAKCQFGMFREDALRDRLVCGIGHDDTQRKLLSTANLTYDLAKHIALQDDAVRAQSRLLAQATSVNAVRTGNYCRQNASGAVKSSVKNSQGKATASSSNSNSDTKRPKCPNCFGYHVLDKCPARDWKCFQCGRKGHVAKKCPVNKDQQAAPRNKRNSRRVNHLEQEDATDDEEGEEPVPTEDEGYVQHLMSSFH